MRWCSALPPSVAPGRDQPPARSPGGDSLREPLWGWAPLFSSLMDRDEGKPAGARPTLHPAGRAGPANYSFSACKCLL